MIRRVIVRIVAWGLTCKHGHPRLSEDEIRAALTKAFPHRNVVWRTEIIEAAQDRNREKLRA